MTDNPYRVPDVREPHENVKGHSIFQAFVGTVFALILLLVSVGIFVGLVGTVVAFLQLWQNVR